LALSPDRRLHRDRVLDVLWPDVLGAEHEEAQKAHEEGLDVARAVGDDVLVSVFLANLAFLADHRGDYLEARHLGLEALRICWRLGRRLMAAWTVSELAARELGLDRAERGAILVGAADQALRILDASPHPGDFREHERVLSGLLVALGQERLDRLLEEGLQVVLG
jgi:hypothetical protein